MRLLDERAAEENEELGKNLRKLFPPLSVKDPGIRKALKGFGVRKAEKEPAEGIDGNLGKPNGARAM